MTLSNLSPDYVLKLKQRFDKASDDYTLGRKELKQFFKCSDHECDTLFEFFDMDGNN